MTKVYVLQNNEKTFYKLMDLGFSAFPPSIVKEFIIEEKECGAINSIVGLLNNPTWQKQYLDRDLKKKMKKENILFTNRKIVLNDEFYKWAKNWVICCNLTEDGMLGITFNFERYPFTFYDKKYIDEYCSELVNKLKALKLVKIKEVEDTEAIN